MECQSEFRPSPLEALGDIDATAAARFVPNSRGVALVVTHVVNLQNNHVEVRNTPRIRRGDGVSACQRTRMVACSNK